MTDEWKHQDLISSTITYIKGIPKTEGYARMTQQKRFELKKQIQAVSKTIVDAFIDDAFDDVAGGKD